MRFFPFTSFRASAHTLRMTGSEGLRMTLEARLPRLRLAMTKKRRARNDTPFSVIARHASAEAIQEEKAKIKMKNAKIQSKRQNMINPKQ